jgi:hypothetical protein
MNFNPIRGAVPAAPPIASPRLVHSLDYLGNGEQLS